MSEYEQIGRLALRHEGMYWNAYWAPPVGMEGAILVGSIRFSAIAGNDVVKDRFMRLMRDALHMLIAEATGQSPAWSGPAAAPEHERAGNA